MKKDIKKFIKKEIKRQLKKELKSSDELTEVPSILDWVKERRKLGLINDDEIYIYD